MNKQIIYPKLTSRLFSTMIDLFLLWIISAFIMSIFDDLYIRGALFKGYMIEYGVNMKNPEEVARLFSSPEFAEAHRGDLLLHGLFRAAVQIFIAASYFIFFWHKYSGTPGKYATGMRVVDAVTFANPTWWQAIKRFVGTFFFIIGIWLIFFTDQNRMLHDKLGGTAVIKR